MGVELRHFVALDAVAQEGSFHGAARRLGYTQSAISQQIAALERVVGQKLIERPGGAQPVGLTRAGEIVREHAHAIGARLATAQADLDALAAGDLDCVRVGFFGRGLGALMPGIARRLEAERPAIELRIREGRRDEDLLASLARGELDISFINLPLERDGFGHVPLFEDDYVLVVRADDDITDAPPLAELAALPLIGFKPPKKTCQLTAFFRSNNLTPAWRVGSDDIETIYALIAGGYGCALLPRLATLSLGDRIRVVELDGALPPRRVGLAWSETRAEARSTGAFVAAASTEAALLPRQRGPFANGRRANARNDELFISGQSS